MSSNQNSITIYEYSDYRAYLRDLCKSLKASQGSFSFRFFSRMAGFSSPNFLKLVMDGQRNLSPESIEKFSRALKHGKEEAAFFRNLVLLNQARTVEERKHHAEQLLKSRPYRAQHPLRSAQYAYYATWYLVPVRELIDTRDFREDPEWIAQRLNPPITPTEARKAIELLLELGLAARDEQGKLGQKEALLSTGDDVASASVAQFHREMMKKGSEAIDRFASAEREISSVTMSLSDEGFRKAKELVQRLRAELMEIAARDRAQTAVYQFNFQLFPLTRKEEPEAEPTQRPEKETQS